MSEKNSANYNELKSPMIESVIGAFTGAAGAVTVSTCYEFARASLIERELAVPKISRILNSCVATVIVGAGLFGYLGYRDAIRAERKYQRDNCR